MFDIAIKTCVSILSAAGSTLSLATSAILVRGLFKNSDAVSTLATLAIVFTIAWLWLVVIASQNVSYIKQSITDTS